MLLLAVLSACAFPHIDPRDAAFPYGYKPTQQERNAISPSEYSTVFMGGRHAVDSNEPDVQRLAQAPAPRP